MSDRDFLLSSDATPIEAGVAAATKARGYSISGAFLRGYEVVAFAGEGDSQTCDVIYKTGPKGILKAEQEAKHAFAREEKKDEDKRRAIRIRYLVSIDPTTIEARE